MQEAQDLSKMSFKRHKSPEVDKSSLDSIWADDASGKLKGYADILTTGLSSDNGNFVLNVNGAWGSGKTFFIERWVASLDFQKQCVIYFNAWENDCCSDPLVSLSACILKELEIKYLPTFTKVTKAFEKVVDLLYNLGVKGGSYLAKKAIQVKSMGFISPEDIDKGIDNCKEATSKFKETSFDKLGKDIISEAIKKQNYTKEFTEAMSLLFDEIKDEYSKPIIIFVDELDRCRPTFAIELLERIKHLFDIDGIKFVVVSDTTQLCESIKKVYGSGFDSTTYLQRFFDKTFNLDNISYESFAHELFYDFQFGIKNNNGVSLLFMSKTDSTSKIFSFLSKRFKLSFREMIKVAENIKTAFNRTTKDFDYTNSAKINFDLFAFLAVLRLKHKNAFLKLIESQANTLSSTTSSVWLDIKNKYFADLNENEDGYLVVFVISEYFGEFRRARPGMPQERYNEFIRGTGETAVKYSKILELKEFVK